MGATRRQVSAISCTGESDLPRRRMERTVISHAIGLPNSMGDRGGNALLLALLSRSQLLHVIQQSFCLFGGYSPLTKGRHVGGLLGFLTF